MQTICYFLSRDRIEITEVVFRLPVATKNLDALTLLNLVTKLGRNRYMAASDSSDDKTREACGLPCTFVTAI